MYQSDREKQTITVEGKLYSKDIFTGDFVPEFATLSDFHNKLYLFLKDWFSPSPLIAVHTSGSTGTPMEMLVEKERMMNSAKLTCKFLKLKKGDTTLLCMSLDYIAGKMLTVRALVAELDLYLISPCGNPLRNTIVDFKFSAMIPMQVFNSLQNEDEKLKLKNIDTLIIGGGAIDTQLAEELADFPNKVYSTYGMTETLSHIALRRINGSDASESYIPFDSVNLSLSEDNALIIDAPLVNNDTLYTNDIVEIDEKGYFRIIGRKDNIINSGGIKIQIEKVEELLYPIIQHPFAISSLPDPKFGEIIVLVTVESVDKSLIEKILPPYLIPKRIIRMEQIPLTETGKIARQQIKDEIANANY